MSFYPIFNIPGFSGVTTLHNFPPNDWEEKRKLRRFVLACWTDGKQWHVNTIGSIEYGESAAFSESVSETAGSGTALLFLAMAENPVDGQFSELPAITAPGTVMPAWRASLAIHSEHAATSYQGEVDPFPPQASLLSFSPFMQHNMANYFLLLNLEKSPVSRTAQVDFIDSDSMTVIHQAEVSNNTLNICRIPDLPFETKSLVISRCNEMTGIPLYFSHNDSGGCLSLEHTHPPASMAIHGNRWSVQKMIKINWAALLP